VEAIAFGIQVNPVVDDWVPMGVPHLLLSLRVHMRGYELYCCLCFICVVLFVLYVCCIFVVYCIF
jgi:hypothetical protein